ncbi:MAG: methyltransferase [Deltaproteobacteria bacterium]|jgi:predicted nicotinamide N-methyase|nr:methyltransferase [Deltaproteobacteria bacterium]
MDRPSEVVQLELGGLILSLEQASDLAALAKENLRTREDPVWLYLWPSGRALARVVADQESLSGRRTLELGAGIGAAGLAAAARGAEVILSDREPEALALLARNRDRNQLSAEILALDFTQPQKDLGHFDLILASDVFYGDGMMAGVLRFLRHHLGPEGLALVTDPMRVQPAGVNGAARLHGLEVQSIVLEPGGVLTGGVNLYQLRKRARPT